MILVLNELAHSMGQPDIYPFTLSTPVVAKLQFVQIVVADVAQARRDSEDQEGSTVYLKDYAPPSFLIPLVELDIDLVSEEQARVRARLTIRRNPAAPHASPGTETGSRRSPCRIRGDRWQDALGRTIPSSTPGT